MYNARHCLMFLSGVGKGSSQTLATDADAEFAALVQRHSRFVFKVTYAVLLNSYDAEDAVQETFLKLYRNHGWMQANNERAFLARVAWRVAIDLKRRLPLSASTDSADMKELASARPGPQEEMATSDQGAVVHACIDSLPEELRVPLVLSAFEELTSREISAILDVPEGTVRTRLQRARQILRQKLTSMKEARYV